ncbi:cysteine desulfurase family protein [Serpentinicella alkaliphila]|uniref:Cysteine desulfurase n=1 Tax=Serpentinicella alkaliphila TaxID=1734049 RepID=A0A4R2U394_9FIRM|nr:cysteine desulfurase family protein [Serpentinicella alkaliphila]QUH26006.1 cysteine desulfurase [Serpentinicella alkaliphila]TCQ02133.1 cysteine desulfurase [Serpentinicella alkaliphila]
MEVYLDNAATTRPKDEVIEAISWALKNLYANPSSLHRKGLEVEKEIKECRKVVARALGCSDKEVVFTSGGTESNSLAINGLIMANRRSGNHIITTKTEHKSVLNTFEHLSSNGFEVTYLDVDREGFISLERLKESMRPDTLLVSIMHANNETGTIQPIMEIGEIIKKINRNTLFHVDGIQGFGKIKFNVKQANVDTYALSGHKIHGPKGIGALYIKSGVKIQPNLLGGSQENNLRAGTENVPGIVGLAKAASLISEENIEYMRGLKAYLVKSLHECIDDIHFNNGINDNFTPHIINVSFKGIRSEIMLHSLEQDGVYVSSGSACTSRKKDFSHVLKAMGLKEDIIDSAIRISISYTNTREEIDYAVDKINKHLNDLRKIIKR